MNAYRVLIGDDTGRIHQVRVKPCPGVAKAYLAAYDHLVAQDVIRPGNLSLMIVLPEELADGPLFNVECETRKQLAKGRGKAA